MPFTHTFDQNRSLKILGIVFGVLNLILWFATPALRAAADTFLGRPQGMPNLTIVYGVQELYVYFDPWLTRYVFPTLFTFGFIAIPFLHFSRSRMGTAIVAILLVGLQAVWLFLIVMGVVFRGPNWNFYWPWEAWDGRVVLLNHVNLSDVFWLRVMARPLDDMPWWLRESPGLALAAGYFVLGLLTARVVNRGTGQAPAFAMFSLLLLSVMSFSAPLETLPWNSASLETFLSILLFWGLIIAFTYLLLRMSGIWTVAAPSGGSYWRCVFLVFLIQLAALAPIKMALRWGLNFKYVIFLPEFGVNV
jgi:hypothetical protein